MSTTTLPFIGRQTSQIKGLDPLRLQSPAIAAYQRLLPGLNNVTARIRAYSFYCWLLRAFAEQVSSNDRKELQRFIRGAEWLLALLAAAHNEVDAAAGINTAAKIVAQKDANSTPYPISKMIFADDGSTTNTFWKNPGGVLAQYYRSTLLQLGLIKMAETGPKKLDRLFVISSPEDGINISGADLAAAFAESIGTETAQHFLSLIGRDSVEKEELLQLFPGFDLARIPEGKERNLLISLLSGPDDPKEVKTEDNTPATNRLLSLQSLLNFYATDYNAKGRYQAFTRNAAMVQGLDGSGKTNECLTGWYYYQLNEEFQFGCTTIFSWLLDYLDSEKGPRWVNIDSFVRSSVDTTLAELTGLGISTLTVGDLAKAPAPDDEDYQVDNSATNQLRRLFNLYQKHKSLAAVHTFADKFRGGPTTGYRDVLDFFDELEQQKNEALIDFLQRFYQRHLLLRHRRVALNKLKSQGRSSEKIVVEGNLIRHIEPYAATETGPRLAAATNFLIDLRLLNGTNGQITPAGREWLGNTMPWN